jgi:alpha-glucosidase
MSISTESINIVINKKPLRIKFYNKKNQLLNEDYKDFGISWIGNEVTCYKKLFPDEKFIGLGEKTGPLNRRGQAYKNWNSDVPAYGIEEDPLYASIPFYIGIHNKLVYGIFLDNTFKTSFNFGASTDDKMSSFSVADGELNYYFFGSGSIEQIIRDYTYLTGHAQLPPLWSLGYQQCRWSYYPDKEVLSLAKNFRDKKIPADVIYLDIHHMQDYKVFTFNSEYFPKPDELISELNKMGFHVVAIVDPGLKIEKGYSAYDEGLANNCFIKYPNGDCYTGSVWAGRSNFPDFTNPKVRDWWGNLFTNYITPGVEGFWNDMNEPAVWGQNIPDIVEFDYDGNRTTMKQAHNIYGMQMSRSTYEGTRKLMNGKRPLVITRATFSGGQRYSTIWTGDNLASDEHMLLGVRIVNSLGICGFPFAGPDIGGFVGEPSRDLIMRWLSLGVYTPFMRNHASYNSNNHEPWTFGKDYEAIAREYINQRYRLLPYIYSAFYQATQTGIPVARTLAIKYTFDEKIYQHEYENEYLFGDNILVAPVVCDQQFEKVFLPEGEWYRISTDEYYKGSNEIIVSSPISDLPVFAKGSAIIPMQSVTQYTSEQPDSILYLHVYKGSDENSFFYYEDDGITYNFENGNCYRRMIYYRPKMKEIVLASKEGIFRSKFRKIKLILHNFDNISKIKIGKESLDVSKEKNTQVIVTDLNNEAIVFKW